MEKTVSAFEARRQFGKILQQVIAKGDAYVVEKHGEPVAAVVPLEVYEKWKREREAFFVQVRQMQARANLSPDEADDLAEEAVKAVRAAGHSA